MKNAINKFLSDYFNEITAENEDIRNECDNCYKTINSLYNLKRTTLEEDDLLHENMNELINFVIKVISNCPYLEIRINQRNKQKEQINKCY